MMADRSRKFLLAVATVLIILTSLGNGAYEQCLTSIRNTVVYEGTLNTILSCTHGPNDTAWLDRPTTNASLPYQITYFNDIVDPSLTGLYAINLTGLIVRNATTTPTGGPISTAGLYIVQFANTTNRIAAKLVVIRSGPICSCTQTASAGVNVSCTIIYADHPAYPINAVMSCTANGQLYNATTPMRTLVPSTPTQYVWNSTSSFIVNNTDSATYDCLMTFAAPNGGPAYLVTNAPDFSVSRQVFCGSTTTVPPTTTTQPPTTTAMSSTATTTPQQTTTTSLPTTSAMEQTVPTTQQMPSSPPITLSVAVVLSVVLGFIFLTTVVFCCWCCLFCPGFCGRRIRRRPRYIHVVKELSAEDYGFWRCRYILRYADNSFRGNQFIY